MKITYEWKLNKLKQVVDALIKNEASLAPNEVRTALLAISEMNKMQGHYSAEKHVNINVKADPDLKKLESLMSQHAREY